MITANRKAGMEKQEAIEKAVEDALLLIKDYKADPKTAAEKMGAPLEKVLAAIQIK